MSARRFGPPPPPLHQVQAGCALRALVVHDVEHLTARLVGVAVFAAGVDDQRRARSHVQHEDALLWYTAFTFSVDTMGVAPAACAVASTVTDCSFASFAGAIAGMSQRDL